MDKSKIQFYKKVTHGLYDLADISPWHPILMYVDTPICSFLDYN